MKAKIKPRINLEDRTKLETVIPLKTPYVIQIEPTNLCNLRCRFCPIGDHLLIKQNQVNQGFMKLDLFKKIIKDLSDFPQKIKTLHLYGNGEPLLNNNLSDMIKIGKKSGLISSIDITTNGILFSQKIIQSLIGSGIDKIIVSVNGISTDQYLKLTQTKINFDDFINSIKYLYDNRKNCKIFIKSIADFYNEKEKRLFFNLFSPISDYIYLENLTEPWPEFSVGEKLHIKCIRSAFSDEVEDKLVCCPIFYTMVINYDGSISLCCIDWKNDLLIGDVKNKALREIWESELLFNHQLQHLKGNRYQNDICRQCNQISHCVYDNIDPYRNELLDKMLSIRYPKNHHEAKTQT